MKEPIVRIENASEATVEFLIKIGILYVDESGMHVSEVQK